MQLLAAVWQVLHQHMQATKTLKQGNRAGIPRQVTKCKESDAQARRPGNCDTVHTWGLWVGVHTLGKYLPSPSIQVRLTRKSSLPWAEDFYGDHLQPLTHSIYQDVFMATQKLWCIDVLPAADHFNLWYNLMNTTDFHKLL